jgi:hypothetical protein
MFGKLPMQKMRHEYRQKSVKMGTLPIVNAVLFAGLGKIRVFLKKNQHSGFFLFFFGF